MTSAKAIRLVCFNSDTGTWFLLHLMALQPHALVYIISKSCKGICLPSYSSHEWHFILVFKENLPLVNLEITYPFLPFIEDK